MPARLRIVYLEDDESAFELVRSLLVDTGLESDFIHVFDEESYRAALTPVPPDAILSDFNLPTIDGMTALELRRKLCPETPFIFVSGALGEAAAIDLLKAGATDFVLKDALPRLVPAIRRSLAEATEHRERLLAERSLRESEERFRRLAENAPDVIFRYRTESNGVHCEYINSAVERISGYRPEEFYTDRRMILRVAHPDDQSILFGILGARKLPEQITEIRWITRDGRTIVTEQRFVSVHDADGRLIGFEGIARDVTAERAEARRRRTLELQLVQAQKMESIGALAGGIAHDFNNILTGILGFTELAEVSLEPGHEALECLEEVRRAGIRAKELVAQLLTFSRPKESNQLPVDLARVVGEAVKFIRASMPATIEIVRDLRPGTVRADPTQIHQIVLNLCTNAMHAMREKPGVLSVRVEPVEVPAELASTVPNLAPGSHLRLSVGDTGHGIDAVSLRRIFDPFYTTKQIGEGTGLGLALVQSIVAAHRGAIRVTSTVGQGATFEVFLPACVEDEPLSEQMEPVVPGQGENILLIDDEISVGAFARARLEQMNYHVTVLTDPRQALAAVCANPDRFAAMVSDFTMPNLTGLDLLREIRSAGVNLPAVIMTGNRSAVPVAALAALPNALLVEKPFSGEILARALHAVLHPAGAEV